MQNIYGVYADDHPALMKKYGLSDATLNAMDYKYRLRRFKDFNEACSYAIICAKSTGYPFEVSRLDVKTGVSSILHVHPRWSSYRGQGITVPIDFTQKELFLMELTGKQRID